ncbi:neural wiskott-aldrich syndrome protein [Anaeramoeba ignava]|uniref:Neural wiskott-aldrich syndrome protein n=1 Tax=Anaeramoeba ignava TaxID=1746090 RepID=A0A9Q0LD90_ANAIG|nr:neural wiskott-aldrich syndrome protein [Anaeramoeba ignava]|eukprot:Anaeramoba_ignava/c11874_g1_i1.p1 GENE.c11874_g1_i1~~c11874_g1_i1.p1  ORF type:complete len:346 (+),score=68.35 c11874_g1_i1:23-1060(+)
MSFGTLNPEERQGIHEAIAGASLISTTVARLYQAPQGSSNWQYTKKMGAISLVQKSGNLYLKLIDLTGYQVIFQQEFYYDFRYEKNSDFFHIFEGDDAMFLLSFANENESKVFYEEVKKATPKQKKEKKGFFSRFKKSKKSEPQKEMVIGTPTNFKHEGHIGFDPEKGFDMRNIPEQWKKLFQQAGVKKSELKDENTMKMLLNVAAEEILKVQTGNVKKGPPPPTPTGRSGAPPPPPTGGGPPPPTGGPPPPTNGPPPPTTSGAPPTPRVDTGRANLLQSIRGHGGVSNLRKIDDLPDISNLNAQEERSLAQSLATALQGIRGAVQDGGGDVSDSEDSSGWSDDD